MNKQITQYIESEKYDKVIIRENHEPMIKVQATDKIIIAHKDYPAHKFVRETIWKKLLKASLNLPDEYKIKFLEGYRPLWKQKEYWDDECAKTRQAHPNWTEEKIQKEANRFVARPTKLANHRCGGAIDIGLIYNDGTSVDMGINHLSSKEDYNSGKKFPMFSRFITKEQKYNREILRTVMENEEFVWYTDEWWHYCYGDRMWAVHTGQTTCFYGPVEMRLRSCDRNIKHPKKINYGDKIMNKIYIHPLVDKEGEELLNYLSVAEGELKPEDYQLTDNQLAHFNGFENWLEHSKKTLIDVELGSVD